MTEQLSIRGRRMGVVVHYASVVALTIFLYTMSWIVPRYAPVIGLGLLTVAIVSYFKVHISTRLWKLTWSEPARLDEREMEVTREAFRRAYNIIITVALILAILALILEYSYMSEEAALARRSFNAVPLFFALVHIAKTLPSSVLAWNEKEIYRT